MNEFRDTAPLRDSALFYYYSSVYTGSSIPEESLICFDKDHTESSGNDYVSPLHAYNNNKFI